MSRLVEWIGAVLLLLFHLFLAVGSLIVGLVTTVLTIALILAPFVWVFRACVGAGQ